MERMHRPIDYGGRQMSAGQRIEPSLVYGVSRARTHWRKPYRVWGWYGWIRWPLSSDGAHRSGHRWPFRWMALLAAKRLSPSAVPATPEQVQAQDAAGSDPARWL